MLLTVERSYIGNYVRHSTLLDRACACSYKNLPKYRSYRVSNTAPRTFLRKIVGRVFKITFIVFKSQEHVFTESECISVNAIDLFDYYCDSLWRKIFSIMRDELKKEDLSNNGCTSLAIISVPARLGKGQGAKEIGHNLAREGPKFGHNLVCKRHKIGRSLERE